MQYQINHIYHIYNRGNNRQTIFFNRDNYLFFLGKMRRFLLPHCHILSYCLMPNHFHFQILATEDSVKTIKVKDLNPAPIDWEYPITCFHYIHQNPYVASLVKKMEDWEFSSFRDYTQLRNGTLCNQILAKEVLKIDFTDFYEESYRSINPDKILKIW